MNEKTLLEEIRRYTLWAVIGCSALLLVMTVFETWGLIHSGPDYADMMMGYDSYDSSDYSAPAPSAVARVEGTLSIVLALSFLTLVTVWVGSWVKRNDAEVAAPKK